MVKINVFSGVATPTTGLKLNTDVDMDIWNTQVIQIVSSHYTPKDTIKEEP